jgi:hypothetical protein
MSQLPLKNPRRSTQHLKIHRPVCRAFRWDLRRGENYRWHWLSTKMVLWLQGLKLSVNIQASIWYVSLYGLLESKLQSAPSLNASAAPLSKKVGYR